MSQIRPGYKTTEFYLTVGYVASAVAIIVDALSKSGPLSSSPAAIMYLSAIGLVSGAVATAMYSLSRGQVKSVDAANTSAAPVIDTAPAVG